MPRLVAALSGSSDAITVRRDDPLNRSRYGRPEIEGSGGAGCVPGGCASPTMAMRAGLLVWLVSAP